MLISGMYLQTWHPALSALADFGFTTLFSWIPVSSGMNSMFNTFPNKQKRNISYCTSCGLYTTDLQSPDISFYWLITVAFRIHLTSFAFHYICWCTVPRRNALIRLSFKNQFKFQILQFLPHRLNVWLRKLFREISRPDEIRWIVTSEIMDRLY